MSLRIFTEDLIKRRWCDMQEGETFFKRITTFDILMIFVLLQLTVSTRESVTRFTKQLQWLLFVDVAKNWLLCGEPWNFWQTKKSNLKRTLMFYLSFKVRMCSTSHHQDAHYGLKTTNSMMLQIRLYFYIFFLTFSIIIRPLFELVTKEYVRHRCLPADMWLSVPAIRIKLSVCHIIILSL